MKRNLINALMLLALSGLAAPAFGDSVDGYSLVKTKDFAASYPRSALRSGQEGWVDVRVTVSPSGEVENVEIVAAEPRRVFERAALRAANRWQFAAPADAGIQTAQSGVFRIQFQLEG